jgi:hypothetical protein
MQKYTAIIIALFLVSVIVIYSVSDNPNNEEYDDTSYADFDDPNCPNRGAKLAGSLVQDYRGVNDTGNSIPEIIFLDVVYRYPNIDIWKHSDTKYRWVSDCIPTDVPYEFFKADFIGDTSKITHIVHFEFETLNENTRISFYVDVNSAKIYAANPEAGFMMLLADDVQPLVPVGQNQDINMPEAP